MQLPSGTLTFLFSDIVASTRLWENEPEAMRSVLAYHDEALHSAIESSGGKVVKRTGDGFHAVFEDASRGVEAAVKIQRFCCNANWSTSEPIRVRIGLHTGESQLRDEDYYGPSVNRAARLMASAHGGQIVCSAPTAELARERLGEGSRLLDLGEHRLRDLARAERVFQIEHESLQYNFPPLLSIDTLPGNLPTQPNRFLGREELVATLSSQLRESRVVTIAGIGGAGKTRLALQVAASLQPEFRDGAWFVDLSTVTDPEQVVTEIFETLDFLLSEGEDALDGLCKRLRRGQRLLLLDNCEQVVAGVARVANAIVATTTDVRILATSREGLGIAAEQLMAIPPLDTGPDGEAVRLFTARASAARPNFSLNDSNRETVTELCCRLDGIPLAIELAAARSRALAPAQILERIDQRFRLLKSGDRTAAARHRTLQAAVDWSYELLSPQQQTALNRLSIFVGGFTLDAAEAVVSDASVDAFEVLDNLDALLDKSLIVADDTPLGRRYRLLETIRQYAGERLDQSDETSALRTQHADFYRALAEAAEPRLFGADEIAALDRLDADLDNLRAMLDWHLDQGEFTSVARVLASIETFLSMRDHCLWATQRLDRCIAARPDDACLAVALSARARLKAHCGHSGVSADVAAARAAAARAGMPLPLMAMFAESTEASICGDMVRAYELADATIETARGRGVPGRSWLCEAFSSGLAYRSLANPGDSGLIERAELVKREIEPDWNSHRTRIDYLLGAALSQMLVDPAAALCLFEERLRLTLQMKCRSGIADSYFFIGLMQLTLGEPAPAARHWRRAIAGHHEVGLRRGMLMTLSGIAGIAQSTGRSAEALTVLSGLLRARRELQAPGSSIEQDAETLIARRLTRELGDQAMANTDAPDLEATIDFSLALLESIERDPALAMVVALDANSKSSA